MIHLFWILFGIFLIHLTFCLIYRMHSKDKVVDKYIITSDRAFWLLGDLSCKHKDTKEFPKFSKSILSFLFDFWGKKHLLHWEHSNSSFINRQWFPIILNMLCYLHGFLLIVFYFFLFFCCLYVYFLRYSEWYAIMNANWQKLFDFWQYVHTKIA